MSRYEIAMHGNDLLESDVKECMKSRTKRVRWKESETLISFMSCVMSHKNKGHESQQKPETASPVNSFLHKKQNYLWLLKALNI